MSVAKKPSKTEGAKGQSAPKRAPVKSLRKDDCWCNIYAFENKGGVNYSVGFSRSYRATTGEWKSTRYFSLDDLGKMIELAQQAHDYIMSQQQEAA